MSQCVRYRRGPSPVGARVSAGGAVDTDELDRPGSPFSGGSEAARRDGYAAHESLRVRVIVVLDPTCSSGWNKTKKYQATKGKGEVVSATINRFVDKPEIVGGIRGRNHQRQ